MRSWMFLSLLTTMTLQGGMLDFWTLKKARDAYEAKAFEKSAKLYEEAVKATGADEAKLDAGDAWYKAGDYSRALELFKSVQKPELQFQKWHNLGNTYARLGNLDEGIMAYEEALKIKEDADTRFNLELLKTIKKKKKEQKQQKEQDQNRSGKNQQNQQNQEDQQDQQSRQKGQSKSQQNDRDHAGQKERQKRERDGEKQKAEDGQRKREKKKRESSDKKEMEAMRQAMQKNEPISDMELRKWEKVLNQRDIHTLMLPVPTKKGERSEDETTPW